MGISNTTKIVCDYVKSGKPCGKTFLLPDDPEKRTPGVENTCALTIGATNQAHYFCSMLHLAAFATEYIKVTGIVNSAANSIKQTPEKLQVVPEPPVDLSLKDDA